MKNKVINIININIKNKKHILIECIYKHKKNINPNIILDTSNKTNIELKCATIDFSNEFDITQINIKIKEISEDNLLIKIEELGIVYNTIILDNKNDVISPKGNEYIIFVEKFNIKILENAILIKKNKKFDKIKNELIKQIYYIKKYKKVCLIRYFSGKKKKYYLFNDRIMYADDNAEQLFKYITNIDKEMAKNSYFVIDKKSPRRKELAKYGKVLKYGSLSHKIKYLNSKMIISSHASYFDRVYNPFTEQEMEVLRDVIVKKFIFLQHGVIYNDLHKMLNRPQIIADLFITATKFEYKEVTSSKYMYDSNMVVCTGLARFDRLENLKGKVILIAPTWRTYLTDVEYGDKNKKNFEKSQFYKEYKALIEDKKLLKKLKETNYKIKFLLHPAFVQFKSAFNNYSNEITEILVTDDISYSQIFKECSIFITDYSSTHFDIAFLNKPIIYYQFDKEKFYGAHYDKGYFDYNEDGFGDVVYKKEELVKTIIEYIESECNIKKIYKDRISKTFEFLDNNNSERIYKEIKKIDNDERNYRFNKVH